MPQEITLTLTVNEKSRMETTSIFDEGYRSGSPYSEISALPYTVSKDVVTSPSWGEGWKFRFPWGASMDNGSDQVTRLEREKEAEEFISSLGGRSLTIQQAILAKE